MTRILAATALLTMLTTPAFAQSQESMQKLET